MNRQNKAWIHTYSGKRFFLLHPRLRDIDVQDIAHALSLQCRWTGHTKFHYSIAQHSWYCSFMGPEEEALDRLLHDASEAYMGDMNRPLKHFTAAGPAYRAQEAVVQNAIAVKFGISTVQPKSVHDADTAMLYAEKEQLLKTKHKMGSDWGEARTKLKIAQWSPRKAEAKFLARFYQLVADRD